MDYFKQGIESPVSTGLLEHSYRRKGTMIRAWHPWLWLIIKLTLLNRIPMESPGLRECRWGRWAYMDWTQWNQCGSFSLRIIPLNLRFRSAGGMKPVIAHDGIQRKEYAAVKYDTTMALDSHDITDSMTAEQAELICLSRCFLLIIAYILFSCTCWQFNNHSGDSRCD